MPAAPKQMKIDVVGGELAAHRLGRRPSDVDPIIAVHGITGNGLAWAPVARALGGRGGIVAVDLRGRGASRELPPPYGTAAYVADLIATIDDLGLERALLVGHSLGAYIVARLAVDHPDRVRELILVDGGLPIPGSTDVEPQQFVDAFLGPAIARLRLTFPTAAAYHEWWRAHPALVGADVADEDLFAYADHDLIGDPPELRSSVLEAAVRADAEELPAGGDWAQRLRTPATLLCAPRGLLDDPHPMQPFESAERWAADRPERRAMLVEGVNHYSITLGATGAAAVAEAIAARVEP
jgi:pimeloyl-ACP methyl ester carboxylesterase